MPGRDGTGPFGRFKRCKPQNEEDELALRGRPRMGRRNRNRF